MDIKSSIILDCNQNNFSFKIYNNILIKAFIKNLIRKYYNQTSDSLKKVKEKIKDIKPLIKNETDFKYIFEDLGIKLIEIDNEETIHPNVKYVHYEDHKNDKILIFYRKGYEFFLLSYNELLNNNHQNNTFGVVKI